jgi:hypothetical protein
MKTRAEILAEAYKIAKAFAEKEGWKGAHYVCDWEDFIVYEPILERPLGCSGYPLYIFVKDGTARWALHEDINRMLPTWK